MEFQRKTDGKQNGDHGKRNHGIHELFSIMYPSTCMSVRHRSVVYHSVVPVQRKRDSKLSFSLSPPAANACSGQEQAVAEYLNDIERSAIIAAGLGLARASALQAGCDYCRSSDIVEILGDRLLLARAGIRRRWRHGMTLWYTIGIPQIYGERTYKY